MADLWLPGAYRDPGVNANYNAGRNQLIRTVAHYTVGNDSRNTGRTGYCHVLVHKSADRENGATCYAPIDAVTWHAANQGNPYGPGIEWERMTTGGINDEGLSNADPLTQNQIEWGQRIVAWCADWGMPAQLWDGDRFAPEVMPGGGWIGWVNHHDIDDQRTDGLTNAEWQLICGGAPAPSPEPKLNREAIELMYGCYLQWMNWVDVYYNGVQVESYENEGPHNVFGIGPTLASLMESGVHVTTLTDEHAYTRKGGLRDQLLAQTNAALASLDR